MGYDRTTEDGAVIEWLLDSDPSIRWQVMRDLTDAPESQWSAERAKVETQGWGARLLSYEDDDGQWAGGSFVPRGFEASEWRDVGQPWTATRSCAPWPASGPPGLPSELKHACGSPCRRLARRTSVRHRWSPCPVAFRRRNQSP